jgi:hypothetical protein
MESADDPLDTVFVPVRPGAPGCCVVRICRRPDGVRTGVAFSTVAGYDRVVGPAVPRAGMSLGMLRALLAEVGVTHVQVDPELMAIPASARRIVS